MALSSNTPTAGVSASFTFGEVRAELNRNELLMWMTQQRAPELPCFNMPFTFAIDGPIDPERFQRAFAEVLARCAELRAVLRESGGIPRRMVPPETSSGADFIDFSHTQDPHAQFHAWVTARSRTPVPIAERMFDTALVKLGHRNYAWFLNVHHILVDGWSFARIYHWVDEEYRRLSNVGALVPIPHSPTATPSVRQEKPRPSSKTLQRAEAHWRAKSRWQPDTLHFYGETSSEKSFRERRLSYGLDAHRRERLLKLIERKDIRSLNVHLSLLNVFCAVMLATLSRVAGAKRLRIGVPFHFREPGNQEIALLHTTCPIDVEITDEETFVSLLKKVADQEWQILRHGRVTTGDAANHGHDVMMNYPNVAFSTFAGYPTRAEWVHSGFGDGFRSLFLQILDFDGNGRLVLHFDANEGVFDLERQRAMVGHFLAMLDSLLDNPASLIFQANLLSEAERRKILLDFNRTEMTVPAGLTLAKMYEAQAAKTPHHQALVFGDRSLTYAELNRLANRMARKLQSNGIGPGVRVAVCARRSVELIAALLGIFKAGGTYVPLDPAYPRDRLTYLLEDVASPVLLTHRSLMDRLPIHSSRSLFLDDLETDLAGLADANVESGGSVHDAAYVIYTSGSTGKPKGVAMSQRALVNLIWWQIHKSTGVAQPRTLQFTPLTFDVSLQETISCWASGGTLVVISDEMRRDPHATLQLIIKEKIEQLFIIFTPLQQIAEAAERHDLYPTQLREVITAGERVQITRAVARFFERMPQCRFENQYGPSETHIVTAFPLIGPVDSWPALPPIGRPVANTDIYILDRHLAPVPLGVIGELYIGGAQVAEGYLNRPDLTSERFLPHHFNTDPGARLYKTGDLARFHPDGNIQFLGRLDHQVKLRGYRIELGEIEVVLGRYPAVKEAVVTVREDVVGDKRLVAYLVTQGSTDAGLIPDLRRYLLSQLPDYMVPSAFVVMDRLPQTPNEKVDRLALPAPEGVRQEQDRAYQAPETAMERTIAGVWASLLRLDRVGRDDDFFSLGGDSLMLVQVHEHLRSHGSVELAITDLFRLTTVRTLARFIEGGNVGRKAAALETAISASVSDAKRLD